MSTTEDKRVVYSATCTWWGRIQQVGRVPGTTLPGCPHCGSPLYEMESLEQWERLAKEHAAKKNDPDYWAFVNWISTQPCIPLKGGGHDAMRERFNLLGK